MAVSSTDGKEARASSVLRALSLVVQRDSVCTDILWVCFFSFQFSGEPNRLR